MQKWSQMRVHRLSIKLRILGMGLGIGTIALLISVAGVSAHSGSHGVTVVSSQRLATGAIRTEFSNGTTVVASPGSKINIETRTLNDGNDGETEVRIASPQHTNSDLAAAAAEYAQSGRSPAGDALAAGIPANESEQ